MDNSTKKYVVDFCHLGIKDINKVGGKNASLGEMIQKLTKLHVTVPQGFATTAYAYREFLVDNKIDTIIYRELGTLNSNCLNHLTHVSVKIRKLILAAKFNQRFIDAVTQHYESLVKKFPGSFAVRSSATAEDLPQASFAGQHDSFLNVSGIDSILLTIKKVYASLFHKRAIAYRMQNKFAHNKVAVSAGIQVMVRSDKGTSGVMFTLDTETGFDKVVFINASWGLGEAIVQGQVNPDEYYVYKPGLLANHHAILQRTLGSKAIKIIYGKNHHATKTVKTTQHERHSFCLDDQTINQLAHLAITIEKHYKKPMDIEWAVDGISKKMYIVQARPETVRSQDQYKFITRYSLTKTSEVIIQGHSVGQKIGQGNACVITNIKNMHQMHPGQVLIADMTDPDWEPIMKMAQAIVTNRGGRTCHAAIVARELGIPAVVGCEHATTRIKNQQPITVSCAGGKVGYV